MVQGCHGAQKSSGQVVWKTKMVSAKGANVHQKRIRARRVAPIGCVRVPHHGARLPRCAKIIWTSSMEDKNGLCKGANVHHKRIRARRVAPIGCVRVPHHGARLPRCAQIIWTSSMEG